MPFQRTNAFVKVGSAYGPAIWALCWLCCGRLMAMRTLPRAGGHCPPTNRSQTVGAYHAVAPSRLEAGKQQVRSKPPGLMRASSKAHIARSQAHRSHSAASPNPGEISQAPLACRQTSRIYRPYCQWFLSFLCDEGHCVAKAARKDCEPQLCGCPSFQSRGAFYEP